MMRLKNYLLSTFRASNIILFSFSSMLLSCDLQNTQPAPFRPPMQANYQQVQSQLETHDFFAVLNKQQTPKVLKDKEISLRMRSKLLGWLQKLALETFNFSKETLITASCIIDMYLEKSNELPNVLQLIGCCGLLIASKLRQEKIVDPDCYVQASCNVFNRRHMLEKERQMYLTVDWRKVRQGPLSASKKALKIFGLQQCEERCEQILWQSLKDQELSLWTNTKLIYGIMSFLTLKHEGQLLAKDSLNLIRLID